VQEPADAEKPSTGSALSAAVQRYELGRRTRQMERAWLACGSRIDRACRRRWPIARGIAAGRLLPRGSVRKGIGDGSRICSGARSRRASRRPAWCQQKQLDEPSRRELLDHINDYRAGLVPLVVPLALVAHYVRRFEVEYLMEQVYLSRIPGSCRSGTTSEPMDAHARAGQNTGLAGMIRHGKLWETCNSGSTSDECTGRGAASYCANCRKQMQRAQSIRPSQLCDATIIIPEADGRNDRREVSDEANKPTALPR
jgi:hypothetical protein